MNRDGNPLWGTSTLTFVAMPMIVSGLFSIFSTKRNDLHNEIEDYDVEEGSFNFYMKKLIHANFIFVVP